MKGNNASVTGEGLKKQIPAVTMSMIKEIIDASLSVFVLLDTDRRIISANKPFLELSDKSNLEEIIGYLVGEALNCQNSDQPPAGCGSTPNCSVCGIFTSVLLWKKGMNTVQEARIALKGNIDELDLRIKCSTLVVEGNTYILASIEDISHEKRRQALERIFFHDILNTAGNVRGIAEMLQDARPEEEEELKKLLYSLGEKLIDEIQAQKELSAAENNMIHLNIRKLSSLEVIGEIVDVVGSLAVEDGKKAILDPISEDIEFESDSALLRRVLGNMAKNAVEAVAPGETVTIGCDLHGGCVRFRVHNPNYISKEIQYQLFHRSFSTKGTGRGLGTYSMKLLTEKYLKGKISFTSTKEEGTTFVACYPLRGQVDRLNEEQDA